MRFIIRLVDMILDLQRRLWHMSDFKDLHLLQNHQGHPEKNPIFQSLHLHTAPSLAPCYFPSVDVSIGYRQSWDHHVGVSDRLHLKTIKTGGFGLVRVLQNLVDVEILDDGVEKGVEVVQQVDNLHWCARRWDRGEADNVAGDGKSTNVLLWSRFINMCGFWKF